MAIVKSFDLKDFKGISKVQIDLDDRTRSPVTTLIGLNESGKTTILEGLSHFVTGDKAVSSLFDGIHSKTSGAGLIPVHRKAAFNSTIEINAQVQLESRDVAKIHSILKPFKLVASEEELLKPFSIGKHFSFEDSVLKDTNSIFNFRFLVKMPRGSKYKPYVRPSPRALATDAWWQVANQIEQELPQISYFPTFLVDMPARIYLREHDKETASNRHYRFVFQEILDSLPDGLRLDKHVCDRIVAFKVAENSASWFSIFFGGSAKAPVDSVFQKISHAVTKEVLGSWQRVFQRTISAKSISIEWNIDTERGDLPYAAFYVSDGESRYAISERSLGFRWFFSFLLFTAFKRSNHRSTIFIFDEPAANLHAKAQAELLTSFARIASDGHRIIYSTHSHHMINPRWLSGAYIVENAALDYDSTDTFGLSVKPTDIKMSKYRDFVSQYPLRSSYFQPVIEKLEYATPEIIGDAPFVIVEGITDYYAFKLAVAISKRQPYFRFLPGMGAGSCGPQIGLLLGRGEAFCLLLDDDKAGRKEAERYKEAWCLTEAVVLTLGDVDPAFKTMQLETLLTDDTFDLVKMRLKMENRPTKKQLGWYLAEICAEASPNANSLAPQALVNLIKVVDILNKRFC